MKHPGLFGIKEDLMVCHPIIILAAVGVIAWASSSPFDNFDLR